MRTVSSERRRLDPVGTRNAILEAAADLFSQKGYDGTSMNDIAVQAKVTKSLLQYHFETKDNLWVQVMVARFGEFLTHVDDFLASDPTPDRLCELMVSRFQVFEKNPEVLRMLTWVSLTNAPIPDVARDRASKLWARVNELARSSDNGQLTMQRMLVTLAAIDGWMLLRRAYSNISSFDLNTEEANAMYLSSLMKLVWNTDIPSTGETR